MNNKMNSLKNVNVSRRRMLQGFAFSSAALINTPGLFAEQLAATAPIGEGPFYPDKMPLDTDNDLLIINDSITPAAGKITHLSGRILGPAGQPIRNAFVEIWQVDNNGVYMHTEDMKRKKKDANFQSYGRFLTNTKGQYYFRTIKPVNYPGRTPHIHVAVSSNGKRIFTTQLLIKGEKRNETDGLFRRIQDPKARETVLADFKPIKGSKLGELSANFDVVLGKTVEELEDGSIKGGVGKPNFRRRRG